MRRVLGDWIRGPVTWVGVMAVSAALVLVGFSLGIWAAGMTDWACSP